MTHKITGLFIKQSIIFIIAISSLILFIPNDSWAFTREKNVINQKFSNLCGCKAILLENRDYFPTLLKAIDEAQKEIIMSFFLFKIGRHPNNYPEILIEHLKKAAKRGIRIQIVLERSDERLSDDINHENQQTAERLKEKNITICFDFPKKTTHTKIIVIDGRYTIIGSHNLTHSALKYNNELSVMIDSKEIAEETIRYIKSLHP
jgi:phosphatidylserine/phosphatidylglycerophosphate/cardiolipin synthase-like enzyme